jgi:cell division protein FtsQ
MKKKLKNILPVLQTSVWIAGAIVLFIVTGAAISHQNNTPLKGFKISVDHQGGLFFVTNEDIEQLIRDNNYEAQIGNPIETLDYSRLEKILENNPHTLKAEIFVNTIGEVEINVVQRNPILRVINRNGVSFYLGDLGNKIPVSNRFTARVPVATGNIFDSGISEDLTDSTTTKKLFHLASYISSDSTLNALIEQIYVTEQLEFVLVPKIGNHVIEIGDDSNLSEKFSKLLEFYKTGLNKVGWQQYNTVNLKFHNQIFATRRTAAKPQPVAVTTTNSTRH